MKKSRDIETRPAPIQRKEPSHEPPISEVRAKRVGKPVQFWMHDEDRRILRDLSAWLAGQGVRASDSLVIRTALRSVKTGPELLAAYREALQLDGRLKQPSKSSNSNAA